MSSARFVAKLIITCLFLLPCSGCGKSESRLQLEPAQLTLAASASVPAGTSTTVTATLRNIGGRKLRIKSVRSSCSCSQVELPEETELLPGRETKLTIIVALPSYGRTASTLTIESDSSTTPLIEMAVQLVGDERTPPYIIAQTREVVLRGKSIGEVVDSVIEVITIEKLGSVPAIEGLKTPNPEVSSRLREVINMDPIEVDPCHRRYIFDVTAVCPAFDRVFGELAAEITENRESLPFFRTKLSVKVSPPVKIIPSELEIKAADLNNELLQRVVVASNEELSFQIRNATWRVNSSCSIVLFESLDGLKEATVHTLDLKLQVPDGQIFPDESFIEFETTHPNAEKCRVSVRCTIGRETGNSE